MNQPYLDKHVLIVEDDANTASVLARVVRAKGISTEVATTLAVARSLISHTPPALVLLDLTLPDGSGLEFLLEKRDSSKARFIILTGDQSQQAAVQCFRAKADDFLTKPVSLSDLRDTIARAADNTRL